MPIIVRLRFAIVGWIGATLFFSAVLALSDLPVHHKPLPFVLYSNAIHFASWGLLLPLLSKFTRAFPLGHARRMWNAIVLLLFVGLLAAVVTLVTWAIIFSTYFPYRDPHQSFGSFFSSELVRFLPNDVLIGIVLVIALEGWRVLLDFQRERIRSSDLERQLAVSRLGALRMQLHPHFLFNTLHTVAGLIVEQPAIARSMVIALGDLLRLTLKDTGNVLRSLAKELEFADLYLGIEKLRLGDRLILNYDLEPEATAAAVPQLLLQPLFENAVRHGAARTRGSCEIRFSAHRDSERLVVVLQNDGPVRASLESAPLFGVGLTNTTARLRLHYKDQFTFQYSDRSQGGARIDISIPYTRADDGRGVRLEEAHKADAASIKEELGLFLPLSGGSVMRDS